MIISEALQDKEEGIEEEKGVERKGVEAKQEREEEKEEKIGRKEVTTLSERVRRLFHEKRTVALSFEDILTDTAVEPAEKVLYVLYRLARDRQIDIVSYRIKLTEYGAIMLLQDLFRFNYLVSAEILFRLLKSPFSPLEWRRIKEDIRYLTSKYLTVGMRNKRSLRNAITELVKREVVNKEGELLIAVDDLRYLVHSLHL